MALAPAQLAAAIAQHRTVAIVRASSALIAARAMDAAVRGGARILEFTVGTPGAFELIGEFGRRQFDPVDGLARPIVGAGTVIERAQLQRAIDSGADFVVSPVFDPVIVAAAIEAGIAVLPGVHTPTEMLAAHRAGATLLKLFPAPAGGPAWLRSVLAPLPMLPVVPTGGVELDNLAQWFEAGAVGVGMVGDVFRPQWLAAGDFDAIHARVAAFRATVQACGPYRGGASLSRA